MYTCILQIWCLCDWQAQPVEDEEEVDEETLQARAAAAAADAAAQVLLRQEAAEKEAAAERAARAAVKRAKKKQVSCHISHQSRGRADSRPAQHQSQQQPPQQLQAQQHGDAPGGNQTYSFADLQRANQELQQLQQQQPMASDNSRQMAQMMQMQMQQMMMSMMAQQQQGGNASPALAAQPAMAPTWNQPAFPLDQALPSSFPSVNPCLPKRPVPVIRHADSRSAPWA